MRGLSFFIALFVLMVIAGPVYGSDGGCIPIGAANWKEGAEKAVVSRGTTARWNTLHLAIFEVGQ